MPQPPQLSASFPLIVTQDPPGHWVVSGGQLPLHVPALQTSLAWQDVVQLPQWVASDETHAPLQLSSPGWHWHDPLWQVCPLPHA